VQEHEDRWLLLEAKRGLQAKTFGEQCLNAIISIQNVVNKETKPILD
jgi:hypothetical protein